MKDKKTMRLRRAKSTRMKIRELRVHKLTVHKTSNHIYAQIMTPDGATTCASASTLDKEVSAQVTGHKGNQAAASVVGKMIAQRAKAAGVSKVAFDRSGFKYHGCVKALADAARESGLEF